MSVLAVINRFLTLVMIVFALVVGFIFGNCNEDMSSMSTWLLVYGFMEPLLCILNMIISRCALPSIFLAMEEESERKIISLLPCIIFSGIVGFGSLIFNIAWTIYGAVLFFPVSSGPYTTCNDAKDGKVLVITGTIIVAFKIIFCLCQSSMPTTVRPTCGSNEEVVEIY